MKAIYILPVALALTKTTLAQWGGGGWDMGGFGGGGGWDMGGFGGGGGWDQGGFGGGGGWDQGGFGGGDFGGGNFGGGNDFGGGNTGGGGGTNSASTFFDSNGAYFGPDCDQTNYSGAYYTGDYTSPFKKYLGKTDADIEKKLDQLWSHYFKGDNNSKVFYDTGNEGYILDINNNDVRSEGMSYGMMITVQTNHKTEFDKLWNWAKNHMWHKSGGWDGYFAWKRGSNGQGGDDNCAPDGEMYFMMSLLFAAHRWNNSGYMNDAQYILNKMWTNGQHKLFNPTYNVITFQPQGNENNFSDPSYDLPAFVDLFARWSTSNQDRWRAAAQATRDHLYKSSNPNSGLFSDYNNFDGTPHAVSYNGDATKYMYDAMRCAMNFGMDYYLFGVDAKRQTEMAKRIINHFEKNGYRNARFNWDGSGGTDSYTLGETGANAVACYALMKESGYDNAIKKNLEMAWNGNLMTGQFRYYDGLVHYLSMLHLLGSFRIWKPAPKNVQEKTITSPYNGKEYPAGSKVDLWEDCKLYKATVTSGGGGATTGGNVGGGNVGGGNVGGGNVGGFGGNVGGGNVGGFGGNVGGGNVGGFGGNVGGGNVGGFGGNVGGGAQGRCSARIVAQGYRCCNSNCVTIYTDADGNWGAENDQWCGCANPPSGNAAFGGFCASAQGYPCCTSTNLIYYTDTEGSWGVENGNWCIFR